MSLVVFYLSLQLFDKIGYKERGSFGAATEKTLSPHSFFFDQGTYRSPVSEDLSCLAVRYGDKSSEMYEGTRPCNAL